MFLCSLRSGSDDEEIALAILLPNLDFVHLSVDPSMTVDHIIEAAAADIGLRCTQVRAMFL